LNDIGRALTERSRPRPDRTIAPAHRPNDRARAWTERYRAAQRFASHHELAELVATISASRFDQRRKQDVHATANVVNTSTLCPARGHSVRT